MAALQGCSLNEKHYIIQCKTLGAYHVRGVGRFAEVIRLYGGNFLDFRIPDIDSGAFLSTIQPLLINKNLLENKSDTHTHVMRKAIVNASMLTRLAKKLLTFDAGRGKNCGIF